MIEEKNQGAAERTPPVTRESRVAGALTLAASGVVSSLRRIDLPAEFPVPVPWEWPPSEPEELARHFTTAEIESLRKAKSLGVMEAVRLLVHLTRGCRVCWKALGETPPADQHSEPAKDPLIRSLWTLTTNARDRLSPGQRLAAKKAWSRPMDFCGLVLEESLELSCDHPRNAVALMDWGVSLALYPVIWLQAETEYNLLGLVHLYTAETQRVARELDGAHYNLRFALGRFEKGSATRELLGVHHAISGKVLWQQGLYVEASWLFREACNKFRGEELLGRRVDTLLDQGILLASVDRLLEARDMVKQGLGYLARHDGDHYPLLELKGFHSLAGIELGLTVKAVGRAELKTVESQLEKAGKLYEKYGDQVMQAERDELIARIARARRQKG